jgi:hypothetical protein
MHVTRGLARVIPGARHQTVCLQVYHRSRIHIALKNCISDHSSHTILPRHRSCINPTHRIDPSTSSRNGGHSGTGEAEQQREAGAPGRGSCRKGTTVPHTAIYRACLTTEPVLARNALRQQRLSREQGTHNRRYVLSPSLLITLAFSLDGISRC